MKKTLLMLLLLLPPLLRAQDSAEVIVERYLRMLNYEALPQDSLLELQTTITFHNSADTFIMKRWYAAPTMMRVEVWHGDTLTTGLCTNGSSRHREYSRSLGWWNNIDHQRFHTKISSYDFRGPLYDWRLHGIRLQYMGTTEVKGQQLLVVRGEQKDNYTRYFMFEKERGLLVLMQEKDEATANSSQSIIQSLMIRPIDYKVVHEYLPQGESLIMSQESFMRDGLLTIMETRGRFLPRNDMIFNQD